MQINWKNIRAIEGQREGFEELVCQLAGQEEIPNQVLFTRIGKPDGGKECYWELNNGDILCWQAKYFTNSLSVSQWKQVDKSVKSAIDNHPKLKKYYIVIPVDRPDGKSLGKSMLQKWNDHVTKWKKYATSKKMKVSFEYWGKHELETRLRKPENEGLIYYFFNETELTDQWFDTKNKESIDALGGRYTPELNFDLPFIRFHDGFTRDQKFSDQINSHYEAVLEKRRSAYLRARQEELEEKTSILDKAIESFSKVYENIDFSGVDAIPFDTIRNELKCVDEAAREISDQLYEWQQEEENAKKEKGDRIDYFSQPYNNELHELRGLTRAIDDFYSFLDSEVCTLANDPYLILVGPAGIGKSHALADIVSERKTNNQTSLLLLGENFSTNEMPWTQILRNQLRFDGNEDVLLGALNAKAEGQQSRIIIVIDALNEGNGRRVWPKRLKSFIRSFHRFPWLGLIVSIRNSFENLIAPENKIDNSIASRIYHPGFEGLEYKASIYFFEHYNIIPPGSPLLHPEFQNPLFLKLFCEGLKKRGLKQVPNGFQGISAIIENYLEGVEEKLAQPNELDYDIKLKLLRKAVDGILVQMVEDGADHLSYETGEEITNDTFSGKCGSDDKQYLKRLISEGVINEDLYWKERKHYYDGIHFAYQRFQDHLIVSSLLDRYLDADNPKKSFDSGPLKELLADKSKAYYNQNIIEALSVQVPERIGNELHEVAPYAATYYATATAFIDGLIWRRTDTIGEASRKYVNEVLALNDDLFYQFLEMSISMTTKPDFYFNADRQHMFLYQQSLAERDAMWTTWLQDKYGEYSGYNSVKRLIDWAWSEDSRTEVNDESVRLAGVMLAWFLTSSNRYLRDAATKALVCLLQNRIKVLVKVLQQFEGVNDPYVAERLYAVAYGCALRTLDKKSLVPLSNYIYKTIFDTEQVYPHILLRDYARGVIEYAIHLDLELTVEVEKIRPPYKSDFPNKLPTNEEIDAEYKPKGKDGHHGRNKWGATAILSSMTTEYGRGGGYGDFGRYTFQSALSNWEVDYDGLSNYGVQRIFELGYDPEVFSDFDSRQGSGRRSGHKERIGKKYQWLVFYEILAKVSDNCKMYAEGTYKWSNEKKYTNYDGPWHPYLRDIDPTVTIKLTRDNDYITDSKKSPWWITCEYAQWNFENESWKKKHSDLPNVLDLIEVKDSKEVDWVNLNMYPNWREPKSIGESGLKDKKGFWYDISSLFIKSNQLKRLLDVDNLNHACRNWSPSISNRYEIFSREYHWSSASSFFKDNPYYSGYNLPTELTDFSTGKLLTSAYDSSIYYLWEKSIDCSKDGVIGYFKPTPLISRNLFTSQREGEYLNKENEVVCYDPSIYEEGPSCLLIRKDYLLDLIKETGFIPVWIIQGEKQVFSSYSDELNFSNTSSGFFYMDKKGKIIGNLDHLIEKL